MTDRRQENRYGGLRFGSNIGQKRGGIAGGRQAFAQCGVDALGQLVDLAGLRGVAETRQALVQEPQTEFGA